MRAASLHTHLLALASMLVAMILAGCDNSVDPFSDSERYFAVFGFLDADRDTQFVRIDPTRTNPELDEVNFDVASVQTKNLNTGEIMVWSDSLVDLSEGGVGRLYYGLFRPIRGHTYEIDIRRSDDASTTASTTVPGSPPLSVRRPDRSFIGTLEQGLLFDGLDRRPERIVVNYAVTFGEIAQPLEVQLPYNVFGAPEGSGWRIIVRLTRDRTAVLQRLSLSPTDDVALHTVSIDLRLLSSDWPLENPGLIETNVQNGFGFFGSAVTHRATWVLDSLTVQELGLIDKQQPGDEG